MNDMYGEAIHLIATWFIREGCEDRAHAALDALVEAVAAGEPGTVRYAIYRAVREVGSFQTLPPPAAGTVTFIESYRDREAYRDHVTGPIMTDFVATHGDLFVCAQGYPVTNVAFLSPLADVERSRTTEGSAPANRHPAVMFELIAKDQAGLQRFYQQVFSWSYQRADNGFAFVPFATQIMIPLGGIGAAVPSKDGTGYEPGYAPGHNFYLRVDDLEATIAAVQAAGGSVLMPPTEASGYRFAMIKDPEANPIGLIKADEAARDGSKTVDCTGI